MTNHAIPLNVIDLLSDPSEEAAAEALAAHLARLERSFHGLTSDQIASFHDHTGIAEQWESQGCLFSVTTPDGVRYPTFQLEQGFPRPAIAEVLAILGPTLSDISLLAWFETPDLVHCRGLAPRDLVDDDPEAVIAAAKRFAR